MSELTYEKSKRKVYGKLSKITSEELGVVRYKINKPYLEFNS